MQVRDIAARLAAVLTARGTEADKIEAALKELSRSGDVGAARAARKAVEGSLKDSAKSVKALQDELDAAGDAKAAAKVRYRRPKFALSREHRGSAALRCPWSTLFADCVGSTWSRREDFEKL